MSKHARPRPSSIDQLPEECEIVVAWAARELAKAGRSQTDIYAEFREKLVALQTERDISFVIPSFSSFNRYSAQRSELMRRHERARMLSESVMQQTDGKGDDAITINATLTLKTLILEMLISAGEDGFLPKEALAMAGAMRSLQIAENLSTKRRQELNKEFGEKVTEAVKAVAKTKGISAEASEEILGRILGVTGA
nr:MAG TPA: Protein of unknown function (DUF3486) [Caudoviricetes sp.]